MTVKPVQDYRYRIDNSSKFYNLSYIFDEWRKRNFTRLKVEHSRAKDRQKLSWLLARDRLKYDLDNINEDDFPEYFRGSRDILRKFTAKQINPFLNPRPLIASLKLYERNGKWRVTHLTCRPEKDSSETYFKWSDINILKYYGTYIDSVETTGKAKIFENVSEQDTEDFLCFFFLFRILFYERNVGVNEEFLKHILEKGASDFLPAFQDFDYGSYIANNQFTEFTFK